MGDPYGALCVALAADGRRCERLAGHPGGHRWGPDEATLEAIAADVAADPNLHIGREGRRLGIAVGYFFPDDMEVVCFHPLADVDGARLCAEALRREG